MPQTSHLRLGVNIDHVATVRNARGGRHPDPVKAALAAVAAGADGVTAHLREDRRHIRDDDIARLMEQLTKPLNFEMAVTADYDAQSAVERELVLRLASLLWPAASRLRHRERLVQDPSETSAAISTTSTGPS